MEKTALQWLEFAQGDMWLRVADPARGDQGTKSWPKYWAPVVFAGLVAWTEKKKPKPNCMQWRETRPLLVVASFWTSLGCWLLQFEDIRKLSKGRLQSVATSLIGIQWATTYYKKMDDSSAYVITMCELRFTFIHYLIT